MRRYGHETPVILQLNLKYHAVSALLDEVSHHQLGSGYATVASGFSYVQAWFMYDFAMSQTAIIISCSQGGMCLHCRYT